jgi:PAS domain-containing protein
MPNADFIAKHAENVHGTYKPTLTAMEAMTQLADLKMQIHRFEVAFNNLNQGVCFFDGSRTLVLANRRYAEIYGLPLECIRVGATLEEIVEHRFAVNAMPNMTVEEYLHWRAEIQNEGLPSDTAVKLKNGRTISIHRRPMPDQGWVSTHEDITARLNREAKSAESIAELPISDLQSDPAANVPIVASPFD